jgi:SAM-dependent methyltransferase
MDGQNAPGLPDAAFAGEIGKIVLSGPAKGGEYTRAEIQRSGDGYQAALYTAKQVFHHNIKTGDIKGYVDDLFGTAFAQYNAWDGAYEYAARVTKKGKVLASRRADTRQINFDRKKNHILCEGMAIPALVDMGVFTKEYKVAAPKRDKFIQINRFLELLDDETKRLASGEALDIIDFGCGKSYLSFAMYHYFSVMRGLRVRIIGMDNDGALVRRCNEAAEKYGYAGLTFVQGDIGQQKKPPMEAWGQEEAFRMVVCLHACDTATDYAIHNAIRWDTDLICAVPCCQHELRNQMQPGALPLLSRYGIVQERIASLATDAIRAALLEAGGYKTQIIELTDRESTAKNLMLRARKAAHAQRGKTALYEAWQVMDAFGFAPTLWRLLYPNPSNV